MVYTVISIRMNLTDTYEHDQQQWKEVSTMERFISRVMVAFCSLTIGGILMKFLYAVWLCNLYIKQIEGITQGAGLRWLIL